MDIRIYHSLTSFIMSAFSVPFYTFRAYTESKTFLITTKTYQIFSQEIYNFHMMSLKSCEIFFLQACMNNEFSSCEVQHTNLTLNRYFRAIIFDVFKELSSSHLLEIFMVADVTTKLRAIKKSMLLKFIHCFPNNFTPFAVNVTVMREFTKIDAISDNFVNFLHEITSFLTIWAAYVIARSGAHASSFILQTGHF